MAIFGIVSNEFRNTYAQVGSDSVSLLQPNKQAISAGQKLRREHMMDTNGVQMSGSYVSMLQQHAQFLSQNGQWCSPSCSATCGQILLLSKDDGSSSSEVVNCFKSRCKCQLGSSEFTTLDLLQKHQEDIRVENLLLEKQVTDLMEELNRKP